jgi:hypothetical protein
MTASGKGGRVRDPLRASREYDTVTAKRGQKEGKARESHTRHGMQVRQCEQSKQSRLSSEGLAWPLSPLHLFPRRPGNFLVPGSDVTSAIGTVLGLMTRCRCVWIL